MKTNSTALEKFIENHQYLETETRGLPDLGQSMNNDTFSKDVKKVEDAMSLYGNNLYRLEDERIKGMETRSLGGGSPMKTKVFPPAKEAMLDVIMLDDMSEYPKAAGDKNSRKKITEYLKREGFESPRGINEDNVIFTVSSTQAFNNIISLIARNHDVVLMTGPNYGLFTFVPERSSGATVEILPLSEEDDWYVNPEKLAGKIDEINLRLKNEYEGKLPYTPKVVAFLNENPHNPLGTVMNDKNKEILEKIGDVCLEKGVFVIDDIIYRDLTYDRDNLSLPMMHNSKYFDNTITITGLSKSYGLAAIRAGMIIASEPIIRGIRNNIFQTMDSYPIIQTKALEGAFNASDKRYREYDKYFKPIIDEYKYRLEMLKGLIEGIDFIEDKNVRRAVEEEIRKYASNDFNINEVLDGIPGVSFVNKTIPQSGFFALLDYTNLKGKSFDGKVIFNDKDLLEFLYSQEKIKLIGGRSISWPNEDEIIGRVTTALDKDKLVDSMAAMNKSLRKLR